MLNTYSLVYKYNKKDEDNPRLFLYLAYNQ